MNIALIAFGIIAVVAAAAVVLVGIIGIVVAVDDYEWPLGVGGALIIIVGLVCIPLSSRVVIAGQRGYGTDACTSFAEQTGYTTRYITTTIWDGGECFVDSNGSWVPKDQLWLEVGRVG